MEPLHSHGLPFPAPARERTATLPLHPRGEDRNNSTEGQRGRGARPASPESGLIPNRGHLSEPHPCSQEGPTGSSSPGLHPHHRDAGLSVHGSGTQGWEVTPGFFQNLSGVAHKEPSWQKVNELKQKVRRCVTILCHLRLKNCSYGSSRQRAATVIVKENNER